MLLVFFSVEEKKKSGKGKTKERKKKKTFQRIGESPGSRSWGFKKKTAGIMSLTRKSQELAG